MSELIGYIEDYFENRLDPEGKLLFESKCIHDESFARDVAFYIAQRKAVKSELLRQKIEAWAEGEKKDGKRGQPAPVRRWTTRSWVLTGTAATVLLAIALYSTLYAPSPRRLAGDYIEKKYSQLSLTMNGSPDSLQQGIAAYNHEDYTQALALFEGLCKSHPEQTDALHYAGVVYLRTKTYDKALERFQQLARVRGLLSNPGSFLAAVTLLRRDAPGDKRRAEELLTEVVRQQTEGASYAADWLKRW
jgi:tetratricopeptide (TPR) repeat protein